MTNRSSILAAAFTTAAGREDESCKAWQCRMHAAWQHNLSMSHTHRKLGNINYVGVQRKRATLEHEPARKARVALV